MKKKKKKNKNKKSNEKRDASQRFITRLNEFYAQPMQPSVSKFRAASDIDCSDYEELYRSANGRRAAE